MNNVEHQLFDALHEIMGLDPATQTAYPSPYLFKINDNPITVELVDVIKMYLPDDAPQELTEMLGYDESSVPSENFRIMLSAEINMPSNVKNYEMAYREILRLNYFGLSTGGCTFALHPENSQSIQMHYLIPLRMADLTPQAIEVFIIGFLAKKEKCAEAFAKGLVASPHAPEMKLDHLRKFI
jgi:hypothetical protein